MDIQHTLPQYRNLNTIVDMLENDATVTTQAAPILNLDYEWNHALLGRAMQHCYKDLIAIANDSGMAIGISNHHGTLLWTNCSRSMLSSAEQVHFIEGGLWSTQAVGNNALGLALDTMHSSCVYSHENEMNSVRDWVCYAAPILDYTTTHFHGIINLSTKSHKHTSLGILAIERCAEMVQRAIQFEQNDVLYIQAFGSPQIQFNQKKLTLTHRQLEILCILILHPNGVHLDELHYALYGDRQVSISTLKAELSQLRQLLNNKIHSRPYRLDCEIQCDFLMAEQAIDLHFDASVLALYKGSFLPKTESPLLAAWRDCFDARLSQLIFRLRDTDQLLKIISRIPERTDAVERLLELLPENHQIRQKFQQLVE